jgi:peptidoglycan lytic transglycosylase
MKTALWTSLFLLLINSALADIKPATGMASWYGEDHRGRLMANGKKFNPDRLTAASWFYPLGTKVRVTLNSNNQNPRTVLVTITDRGPAKELVRDGRIIDLTHAAFKRLGRPAIGLVAVTVEPLN